VRVAIHTAPTERPRDVLAAWWRRWPRSFATAFGDDASAIHAWADAAVSGPNLTRIANAYLANVL
jgi:hypothetical protein